MCKSLRAAILSSVFLLKIQNYAYHSKEKVPALLFHIWIMFYVKWNKINRIFVNNYLQLWPKVSWWWKYIIKKFTSKCSVMLSRFHFHQWQKCALQEWHCKFFSNLTSLVVVNFFSMSFLQGKNLYTFLCHHYSAASL